MSTLEITPMTSDDFDLWKTHWNGFLKFYDVTMTDEASRQVWDRLMTQTDPLLGLKAVSDGVFIGFVHFYFHGSTWSPGGYCYLEDLYVSPNARGLGCGRELILAVQQIAKDRGAAKLYWHTDQGNERARGLYDQLADLTEFVRYDVKLMP